MKKAIVIALTAALSLTSFASFAADATPATKMVKKAVHHHVHKAAVAKKK